MEIDTATSVDAAYGATTGDSEIAVTWAEARSTFDAAIIGDLKRLAGDVKAPQAIDENADFAPILTEDQVSVFKKDHLEGVVAFLMLTLGLATKSRADLLSTMHGIPTSATDDSVSNCEIIEGIQILREWFEDTLAIVRAVELRLFVVAEQVARERGELEEEIIGAV